MAVTEVTFYPPYNLRYGHASGKPDLENQNGTASDGTALANDAQCNDVADGRRSAKLTIDTASETDEARIDMQMADDYATVDATNWDFLILDNHNLDTATGGSSEIHLRNTVGGSVIPMSAAYSGTLGSTTEACTISSNEITDIKADGITVATTTSTNANSAYRTVYLDDNGTYAADITIGEITLGKKFTAPFRPNLGISYGNTYGGVKVNRSQGGQSFSTKRYGRKKSWGLEFNLFDETAKTNFEVFFDIVEGARLPFHFSLDSDSSTPTFYYGRLAQNPVINEIALARYSTKLQILEEL